MDTKCLIWFVILACAGLPDLHSHDKTGTLTCDADCSSASLCVCARVCLCVHTQAILDHAEEVVNLRDGKGRAALHYACAEGSVDCIRTLLAYKRWEGHKGRGGAEDTEGISGQRGGQCSTALCAGMCAPSLTVLPSTNTAVTSTVRTTKGQPLFTGQQLPTNPQCCSCC